jgi:carbonic anhydrase
MLIDRRAILMALAACPACAAAARGEGHWSYDGDTAPDKWGKLDNSFQACSIGSEQSPIDLKGAIRAEIPGVSIAWKPQSYKIANNGHTIQLDAMPGDTITVDGQKYELKQFHFHTPSEHALDGARMPMEAHFVHAQTSGRLAVVGVLMKAGSRNAAFSSIMEVAPTKPGALPAKGKIDPSSLLPTGKSMFRYEGSLTTPPCSEIVDWNVFEQPIEVEDADIAAFKAIFPMNARPLQPINRRFLLRGA